MTLIAGENITKRFDDHLIFENLSFSINKNDRIGLVGPNGIGKTTLFDLMVGLAGLDYGNIVRSKECTISYVEQALVKGEETLSDYVLSARSDLIELRAEIDSIQQDLETNPDSDKLIQKLGDRQQNFETSGGYDFESEVKIILNGLGFPKNRFHNRLREFSGGEKNRASLARVLAGNSNLLLLDEPTNHLDIESTVWLEEYLKSIDKAYIIVSHDRTFLTNTINKVWELTGKKIDQYFNGFESFLKERDERIRLNEHRYRHQQDEIKRIEDFIRRNMAGQKTKQAQSRQKYLARIKRIELTKEEGSTPSISIDSGQRSYNLVLTLEKADFGYGHKRLVTDVDFHLYRGDKVGMIGKNGCGKTTMLKSILGELELIDGTIRIGNKVDVAYFDQELSDLDVNNTVLDELWLVDPLAMPGRMRQYLARFGFTGEDVFKRVEILSGGEKTKLALAKLLFEPANFLVFDEPTNHLDIDSRQALEDALIDYSGACLIVSHDRYFLNRVADRILAIEDGQAETFDGNYSYYCERVESKSETSDPKAADPARQQEYAEFKKQSQIKGRLKKEIRSTKSKIADHEMILEQLEEDIVSNIPKSDWEKLEAATKEKEKIEEELLKLLDHLEKLEKENAAYTDN